MPCLERGPDGGKVQNAKAYRRVDPQLPDRVAAACRDLGFGGIQPAQQLLTTQVKNLTVLGQRQPTCGPVQQAYTQPGFQVGHIARDCRLGHVQRLRRADKTTRVHHLHKGAHFQKSVHWLIMRDY